MSELCIMTTITDRDRLSDFLTLYEESGVSSHCISLGHGTAPANVATVDTEKAIIFSVVTDEWFREIKKGLLYRIRLDVPGTGIVFLSPLSTIGGKREYQYFTDGLQYEKGEESTMKETNQELLVVISNQGYNDLIMEAARSAGAGGGTILHAQGTGRKKAEKFLGISLASEKDITLIVVRTKDRNPVMEAIMKQAGLESKAKGIVFSLPITDTAGCRFLEENYELRI